MTYQVCCESCNEGSVIAELIINNFAFHFVYFINLHSDLLFLQLKDLLANAFDDLEADDTCSVNSDESQDSGRHSDELG